MRENVVPFVRRQWSVEPNEPSPRMGPPADVALADLVSSTSLIARHAAQLSRNVAIALGDKLRLEELRAKVAALEASVSRLERRSGAVIPLRSLDPEPFDLDPPINVVVRSEGDGYLASFVEGNIAIEADTEYEAIDALKGLIADVYEKLSELPKDKLGRGPRRQLEVLNGHLRPRV